MSSFSWRISIEINLESVVIYHGLKQTQLQCVQSRLVKVINEVAGCQLGILPPWWKRWENFVVYSKITLVENSQVAETAQFAPDTINFYLIQTYQDKINFPL